MHPTCAKAACVGYWVLLQQWPVIAAAAQKNTTEGLVAGLWSLS